MVLRIRVGRRWVEVGPYGVDQVFRDRDGMMQTEVALNEKRRR